MRKAAVRKTARKGDGPRGAKLLGDFASYLISSEILLCPTAPPSTVPLFLLLQTPPPSPFLRPALLATTLPGAFTATSFTISKGQCASLFLSLVLKRRRSKEGLIVPFGHFSARRPFAREENRRDRAEATGEFSL